MSGTAPCNHGGRDTISGFTWNEVAPGSWLTARTGTNDSRSRKSGSRFRGSANVFADAVVAGFRNLVPPDLLTRTRNELISPTDLKDTWPKDAAPHPGETIRVLRLYASLLRKLGSLGKKTGINSTDTLWKYVFSAYVHRATQGFHDVQVSRVIEAVLNEGYDETAHRMWRSRNYERIDADLSFLPKLLIGIGFVSSSHA